MVKRICALVLALLLLTAGNSLADLKLKDRNPAQKMLATYIANVNEFLAENGEFELNRIFDEQNTVVELGITSSDEDYEYMTFKFFYKPTSEEIYSYIFKRHIKEVS